MSGYIARIAVLLFVVWLPNQSIAETFKVEQVIQLPGIPWGMDFLDQNNLIVTLRSGSTFIVDIQQGKATRLNGLPEISASGQGGLLDVAISPGQDWIYFTYSKSTRHGKVTTLARAKLEESNLTNWQDLLITDSATDTGRHFGSRIAFDGQEHVFFGIGDRGVRDNCAGFK